MLCPSLVTVLQGVPLRKGPTPLAFLPARLGRVWASSLYGRAETTSCQRTTRQPERSACSLLSSCALCPVHRTEVPRPCGHGPKIPGSFEERQGRECLLSACLTGIRLTRRGGGSLFPAGSFEFLQLCQPGLWKGVGEATFM